MSNLLYKLIRSFTAMLILVAFSAGVYAVPIDGEILFSGTLTTDTGNLQFATQINTFSNESVIFSSGDYAADGLTGNSASFAEPLDFTPDGDITDITPFWTVVGDSFTWTFDLETITVVSQGAGFLNLSGTGTAHSTDGTKDSSFGTWSLSADNTGATIAFSSTTNVPEPQTLVLLGLSLIGIAAIRLRRG